jgi:hypothetical protein
LENYGSLTAISAFIHKFVDGIDKAALGFPVSRFVHPEDMIHISLTGGRDCTVPIPREFGFDIFKRRIVVQLGKLENAVTLEPSETLMDGISLKISIGEGSSIISLNCDLPSRFLEDYKPKLIQMFDHPEFGIKVYDMLRELRLEDWSCDADWRSFFKRDSYLYLLYQLNVVGCWILKNGNWKSGFVAAGGANELFELLFRAGKLFKSSDGLLLICQIVD